MADSSAGGEIRADTVYSLPDFLRRVRLKEWAFRKAKQAGLKPIRVGRNYYVRGSDWLDFLARQAEQQAG